MDVLVSNGYGKPFLVLSGADGSILRSYFWGTSNISAGGVGDLNGDGTLDFLLGEEDYVQVVSGACLGTANQCALLTIAEPPRPPYENDPFITFGHSVSAVGDVNADGTTDILVGSPAEFENGRASLYSGADGSLLLGVAGGKRNGWSGSLVKGVGDTNADGIADFVVADPGAHPRGVHLAGKLWLYSGATLEVLKEWRGTKRFQSLGSSLAALGDVNLDGYADIALGNAKASPNGLESAGRVSIYSGKDHTRLLKADGTVAQSGFGYSVAAAGDVNGDGRADLIVGEPFLLPNVQDSVFRTRPKAQDQMLLSWAGRVSVVSGADGSTIFSYSPSTVDYCGAVTDSFDVNGDGRSDVFVNCAGYLKVFSLAPTK